MRTRFRVLVLFAVLLGGCMPDLRSDRPPDRIYWLEAPVLADPPALDLRLSVVPGLDSDRLSILERDQRLNVYAGAYWPETLEPLLESLLRRSLDARSGLPGVHVLVERFFAVEVGMDVPPEVVVSALIDLDDVRCRFEHGESLEDDRLRDVVAGHQRALAALAAAIATLGRTGRCP